MKMYLYIMHDRSKRSEKILEGVFNFSHLLIRVLLKGLSIEMHYYMVHFDSKQRGIF